MFTRLFASTVLSVVFCSFAGIAAAQQGWSAEQKEIWAVEEQQWKLAAAEDPSWINTMVHPNLRYWEIGDPFPRNRDSLDKWNRFGAANGATLEQELFPISITITGDVAVVQYNYMVARENYKKERETVTGWYTDVLVKENGRWLFLAWAGGDRPQD
jgi:hypothetical protein